MPPGPPPPGPPPGVGVVITGHHNWFNVFQPWEDFVIDEVLADIAVVTAVQAIRDAKTPAERIGAVNELIGRIG